MLKTTTITFLFLITFLQCTTQIAGGGDVVTTRSTIGYVYYDDGRPAPYCEVTAIASDNQSERRTSQIYYMGTDSCGKYELPQLPSGTYNIFSKKEFLTSNLVSYLDKIEISSTAIRDTLPKTTLKLPGRISGTIKLSGKEDCRTVLILIIGGSTMSWPYDTSGAFTLNNMAEGTYKIRFLSTLNYPVLDTSFNVFSQKVTDAGIITLQR